MILTLRKGKVDNIKPLFLIKLKDSILNLANKTPGQIALFII